QGELPQNGANVTNPPPVASANGGTGNVIVGQGGTGANPSQGDMLPTNPELVGNGNGGTNSTAPTETPPSGGNGDDDDDDNDPPPVVTTPPPVVTTPPPVVTTPPPVVTTPPPVVNPPPGDCNTPPPASPLQGWAAVPGRGVNTTTGGGNANPT